VQCRSTSDAGAGPSPLRESEPTGALSLPTGRGRYVLLLEVVTGVSFPVRSGATFDLRAGTYAYVGSAAGSGGVAARVSRHLRRAKQPHWHIDHLLMRAEVRAVVCFGLQVGECALAGHLENVLGGSPVPGFGCSDCRCPSHLFLLPKGLGACELAASVEQAQAKPPGSVLGLFVLGDGTRTGPP